jgi:predicted KAP-like P-loop ATPase
LHDFNKLVQFLYVVDVDESKLESLLQFHENTPSAELIADLIIERQQEKILAKQQFKFNDDIPDEERW